MNEQNEIEEDVLAISCEYPLVMNINELGETKECDERIKRPFVVSSNKVKEFFSQKRDKDIDRQISSVKEKFNIEMPKIENNMSLRLKRK